MTLEGIKDFQRRVVILRDELAALQTQASMKILTASELEQIDRAKRRTEVEAQQIQSLPLDEPLWRVMDITVLSGLASWLRRLQEIFEKMAGPVRERSRKNRSLAMEMRAFAKHAGHAKAQLHRTAESFTGGALFYREGAVCLSPGRVLALLKISLFPDFIRSPYPELAYETGETILYHPRYTQDLMVELVMGLNQRQILGNVGLTYARTASFFEMALTVQDLRLRPDTWQAMLDQIYAPCVEMLYEIGGQIEPLTWTDGQGEGVNVRLPWAKAEGETNDS
jgi:hypothetical protein